MVYIDNTVELETRAMKQIQRKRPEEFNEKISKVIVFMADSEKRVKVGDTKVLTLI